MTIRAAVFGLLGAIAICTLTYLNDYVLRQTFLVGNNLPVSVYGALIIFVLLNSFVYRFRQKLALTGKEFALILAMTLAACCVPSSGLLRTFSTTLMLPHFHNKTNTSWTRSQMIEEVVPERMLVSIYQEVHRGQLALVDEKGLTLDGAASGTKDAYLDMHIRILSGKAKNQLRKIVSYDAKTKLATIETPWKILPEKGDEFSVRRNNEDEVLTPFIQGQSSTRNMDFMVPITGRALSIGEKNVKLSPDEMAYEGTYVGMSIKLTSGDGKDEERTITSFDPQTGLAGVDKVWPDSVVDTAATYEISPPRSVRLAFWAAQDVKGLVQAADATSLTLPKTASSLGDAFCDMMVTVSGQSRLVVNYDGTAKKLVVDKPFSPIPKAGDEFLIVVKRQASLSGSFVSVDGKTVRLAAAASHKDQEYTGMELAITAGKGAGQKRRITAYDGLQQTATVETEWDTVPDTTSAYMVTPKPSIPWYAWRAPLTFWIPLILALWIALIALSMVVHKQWGDHEHLPYPIATFTASLLPEEGKGLSAVFHDRKFWITAGVVLTIYTNNYIYQWVPDYWVSVPRSFDFSGLVTTFGLKAWWLNRPTIYLTVIAIAYFLASDVSLSIGLSGLIYAIVFGSILSKYGLSMDYGDGSELRYHRFMTFGSYVGLAAIIIYTGRQYYANVLKKAFCLPTKESLPSSGIWGMRLFIVAIMVFILLLTGIGLDWQLAMLYAGCIVLMFLVMGRIIAETGLFFIQTNWWPSAMIIGILGIRSMSPESMCILFMLCAVLAVDPREALMPFMVNSTKLLDLKGHKVGRAIGLCTAALVVGLAVGVPATIYYQYRNGANFRDRWATNSVPMVAINNTVDLTQQMEAKGVLEDAKDVTPMSRIGKIRPMRPWYLGFAGIGCALVLVFSFCRLRFSKWPLHPIIFLVWTTYPINCFAFSFFLGWVVKALTMRFGGSKVYQNMKPLIIGLIAGELLGALLPILFGLIYFFATGELPKDLRVFPG